MSSFYIKSERPRVIIKKGIQVSNKSYKFMSRNRAVLNIRTDTAIENFNKVKKKQTLNGDETLHLNKISCFTKGLEHDELGIVNLNSFLTLKNALITKNSHDFEKIKLKGTRKLVNPQAGLCFDLEGEDCNLLVTLPPYAFSSDEMAGDIVEIYWMALCRDINFIDYSEENDLIPKAVTDLNNRTVFNGPKENNFVTVNTLFKGLLIGDLIGPYISQFFYLPIPFGASQIDCKLKTFTSNHNFMTDFDNWKNIQDGFKPTETILWDTELRYIRNGRDLAAWVRSDISYQAYFNAMLILLTSSSSGSQNSGIGCPLNVTNPYIKSMTQDGFATFGSSHICTLLANVSNGALKHAWYHKWYVHLSLRPEALGGAIHLNKTNKSTFPLSYDLNTSSVFDEVNKVYGTYLLPLAYPEGSPLHPSYPAGHAAIAGACVTVLKAFFDENYVIKNPKIPSNDGLSLEDYVGPELTVGNELNKIASNVSLGRNFAGVHYRKDDTESKLLGETFAISVLKDQKFLYNETFTGWKFTKFDGTICEI
jgi:membrane-associated phospholipid phosphatase